MTEPLPAPITAHAADEPCAMYKHGGGQRPSVTHAHYLHPRYLQQRKYGEIRDDGVLHLCGTCHDSVHAWIGWLLGERSQPKPEPPFRARRMAEQAVAWFQSQDGMV